MTSGGREIGASSRVMTADGRAITGKWRFLREKR